MIDLNPSKEPLIHAAIKRDALLENVQPHPVHARGGTLNANRHFPHLIPTPHTPHRKRHTLTQVVVDENLQCLYSDGSRTENTRGSFPSPQTKNWKSQTPNPET